MNTLKAIGILFFAASIPVGAVSCVDQPRAANHALAQPLYKSLPIAGDDDEPLTHTIRTGDGDAERDRETRLNNRAGW